jgi:hypothetical protein
MQETKNNRNKMKDLLENINKIYVEQLSNCSEICRKVVFALYAATWGITFLNGGLKIDICFILVFIFLTLYLCFDVIQYYLTAIRYRNHFHEIIEAVTSGESDKKIYELEKIKRKKINDDSYLLLKMKISLLPFAFILLIVGIIRNYIF